MDDNWFPANAEEKQRRAERIELSAPSLMAQDWFGFGSSIVQAAGATLGAIQLGAMNQSQLNELKTACKWEAWFKADEVCTKKSGK